jgi:hypothetical protein
MHADDRNWSSAIDAIESMSVSGQARRDTKYVLASAYAGRCGLELLSLADSIANGVGTIWPTLLSAMRVATSVEVADCQSAESTLMSIGTFNQLTVEENVLLAFVAFAKMGAVLAASGIDTDNDGARDGGSFNACTNNSANITSAMVKELGTGITIAASALAASGSSVASGAIDCSALDTALGMTGFCNQVSVNDFDNNETLVLRALIKSNEIGFNSCGGSVGSSASCSCP